MEEMAMTNIKTMVVWWGLGAVAGLGLVGPTRVHG